MIAELFELPPCDATRLSLGACREELHRELLAALKAVSEVPDHYIDLEMAAEIFRHLAEDGDTDWAREQLTARMEYAAGFARHFDRLQDHVNTIGWAYWRLHRAERRAYGKERA